MKKFLLTIFASLMMLFCANQSVMAQINVGDEIPDNDNGLTYKVTDVEVVDNTTTVNSENVSATKEDGNATLTYEVEDSKTGTSVTTTYKLALSDIGTSSLVSIKPWSVSREYEKDRSTKRNYTPESNLSLFKEYVEKCADFLESEAKKGIVTAEKLEDFVNGQTFNTFKFLGEGFDSFDAMVEEYLEGEKEYLSEYPYYYYEITLTGIGTKKKTILNVYSVSDVNVSTATTRLYSEITNYIPTSIANDCVGMDEVTAVNLGNGFEFSGVTENPFKNATSLETITSGTTLYKVHNGMLYSRDYSTLIAATVNANDKSYDLMQETTNIFPSALAICKNVTLITPNASIDGEETVGGVNNKVLVTSQTLTGNLAADGKGFVLNAGQVVTQDNLNTLLDGLKNAEVPVRYCYIDMSNCKVSGSLTIEENATLNPNCLLFFAEGTNVSGVNTVVAGTCGEFVLTDGDNEFYSPIRFEATMTTVNRSFTSGKYGTLVLPFAVNNEDEEFTEALQAAKFTSYDPETQNCTFTYQNVTSAYTPYVVKGLQSVSSITFYSNKAIPATAGKACTTEVNGGSFTGTLQRMILPHNEGFYYITSDAQIKGANKTGVNPFRAYLQLPDAPAEVRVQFVEENGDFVEELGDATNIESVETSNGATDVVVYSINGSVVKKGASKTEALDGLQAGVYIVNGKKYIVK